MTVPVLLFPIVSDVFLDDFSRTFASAAVQRGFDVELLLPASIRVAGIHFVNQFSNPKIRTASFTLNGFADCIQDAAKQNRAALFLLRSKDLCSTHRQLLLSLSRFLQSASGGLMPFVIDLEDALYRNVLTSENGTEDVVSITEAQWTKFAEFQLPLVASRTFQLEQSDHAVVQQQFDDEIQGPEPRLDNLAYDLLDIGESDRPDLLKHYNQFVEYHEQQLTHMQLPQKLWKKELSEQAVYFKIHSQTFDAGADFSLLDESRVDDVSQLCAVATRDISPGESVWLIDHAWSSNLQIMREQLQHNDQLVKRMLNIFGEAPHKSLSDYDEDIQQGVASMQLVLEPKRDVHALIQSFQRCDGDLIAAISDADNTAPVSEQTDAEELQQCQRQNIDLVLSKMWSFARFYKVADASGKGVQVVWYVQDELGAAIQIARTADKTSANVRCSPFIVLTLQDQPAFDLLWTIKPLSEGDKLYRDLDFQAKDRQISASELSAHDAALHKTIPTQQVAAFLQAFDAHTNKMLAIEAQHSPSVSALWSRDELSANAQIVVDNHVESIAQRGEQHDEGEQRQIMTVFSDLVVPKPLTDMLNSQFFRVIDSPNEADILWYSHLDFKDWSSLKPNQFINKFRYEANLTYKHLLSRTIERYFGNAPFKPVSYNSQTQIAEFVGDFLTRQKNGQDNTWMCKPSNSSHSLGHTISQNLQQLIRISETDSVIFQKYIDRPLLFRDRKFDLRFIVLLKSVQPLDLMVCSDFLVRVSNLPFELDHFDQYERHFTVHNYRPGAFLTSIRCTDFVRELEQQYEHHSFGEQPFSWPIMLQRIHAMFKDVFTAATQQTPPDALEANMQCRGMYGIDVMIDTNGNPQILECNFSPDNTRFMGFDPLFFDAIFSALFHDKLTDVARERVIQL